MKKLIVIAVVSAGMFFLGCEDSVEKKVKYTVKEEESFVTWIGKGVNVENTGSFSIEGDNIVVEANQLKSGSFVVPISTLNVINLPEGPREMLTNHLKSADFFDIVRYPEAKFTITEVVPYEDEMEEANNMVKGEFTMLNKTNIVSFPARIVIFNNSLMVEGILTIDRTQWGMNYAADPALGEHYILPNVSLNLKVVAQRIP